MGFVIEGIPEFTAGIAAAAARAEVATEIAMIEATALVVGQAQRNADTGRHPRGQPHIPGTGPGPNRVSGTLHGSIRGEPPRSLGVGVWEGEAGVTTDAFYGAILEGVSTTGRDAVVVGSGISTGNLHGSGKFPFFGDAVDQVIPEIAVVFEEAFRRAVEGRGV